MVHLGLRIRNCRCREVGTALTAIVGIASGGRTWMGWDSCVSYGDERAATLSPKGWRDGQWLIGAAGSGAWFATLRSVKWPKPASVDWPEVNLARALMQSAASLGVTLPRGGSSDDEDSAESGCALVGGSGGLWRIDSSLDVSRYDEAACGSGSVAARAVLHVLGGTPRVRIRRALDAAAAIVPGVSEPFTIESV